MVAYVDGVAKVQAVDRDGDDFGAGVSLGGHSSDHVYPGDDLSAKGCTCGVGVFGHEDVSGFDGGVGGGFGWGVFHISPFYDLKGRF